MLRAKFFRVIILFGLTGAAGWGIYYWIDSRSPVLETDDIERIAEQGDLRRAAKLGEKRIVRYPEDASAHFVLGQTYFKLNRIGPAVEHLETVFALCRQYPDNENYHELSLDALRSLGEIHLEFTKEYGKAAGVLKLLVEAEPRDWEGHYQLGTAYAYLGRSQNAYNEFNQVIKEDPDTDLAKYAENAIQYLREKRNPGKSKYLII